MFESHLILGANLISVLRVLLWIVFAFSSLLLIFVVLIQEGKGGGLGSFLGGGAAETFGVSAGGINKFTATLAAVFMVSAILLAATTQKSAISDDPGTAAPIDSPSDE